jgi:ubiquinone/menaquinone biosynthesis C-methylase UbiE
MRIGSQREDHYRRELLHELTGRVIEIGAGHGLNFAFYPPSTEYVLAVEPEPVLRAAALKVAANAEVSIEVVDGVAGQLPADDASFDAAVTSLVLCSVSNQARALSEMQRVLHPGGRLHFYEHVAAHHPVARGVQRLADATLWPRVAGGCHLTRETTTAITAAGFEIEQLRRFNFTPAPPVPPIPHVLGIARRPAND